MIGHRDYYERLSDFVIDEALPYDVLPVVYVLYGDRAYGDINPYAPYHFVGIHLFDTQEYLQAPALREREDIVLNFYDTDLKKVHDVKNAHLVLESYEWSKFVDLISFGHNKAVSILHNPIVHEDRIFQTICPHLIKYWQDLKMMRCSIQDLKKADKIIVDHRRSLT